MVKPPTPPTPPLLALTTPSPSSFRAKISVTGEPPFHRLPSRGNPTIEFAGPPSLSLAPRSELSGTGATGGQAPASSRERQWPPVHGGPESRWSTAVEPAHGFSSSEITSKFCYFGHFALKPLGFSKINLQYIIFQSDPRV
jgi:hypothetical protein